MLLNMKNSFGHEIAEKVEALHLSASKPNNFYFKKLFLMKNFYKQHICFQFIILSIFASTSSLKLLA